MISTNNLKDKIKEIDKSWSPIEVARVNDQVVRMALFKGEFHWHKHTDEDELFYVYSGSIIIQLKDRPYIALHEGEMAVIPKGVEHCPKSVGPSYVLMFEPYVLQTRGDQVTLRLTAPNSMFAVRTAHPNTFGTSQTRKPLSEIVDFGYEEYLKIRNI